MRISVTVNGVPCETDVWGGDSLLTMLRDTLELPGSKNACEQGECGSCSVLVDGELVCACLVLAAQVDGHEVISAGDIALHLTPWKMTGVAPDGSPINGAGLSVAVLRRQPDGKWLMVIDNPFGDAILHAKERGQDEAAR